MRTKQEFIHGKVSLKMLGVILGVPLGAFLFSLTFFRISREHGDLRLQSRFNLGDFVSDLPSHSTWLIPFCLLSAMIIPLRALQWQATLSRHIPYRERYHTVAIGMFVHNVVPGKLGELFRSFLLSRTQNMPFIQTLGSVLVCKLLEFAALMGLVALSFLGPFSSMMSRFGGAIRLAIPLCLLLVLVTILLARYAKPIEHWLKSRDQVPRVQLFLHNMSEGLGTARSAKGMVAALLLSIGPVLAPALAYGIALRGMEVGGGLFAGAVVLGAIALGQMTPGIPAGTGIYYFVTSWAARTLGASAEQAAAFAMLTHISTLATHITVGTVSVWIRKVGWKDLRRRATQAVEAAKHVGDDLEPARA